MYKLATLNKISPAGLNILSDDYSIVEDAKDANSIIVRSADMHSFSFSHELLAIARAGAGYNNIPIERCAEDGIVVFNTPGANANAVKELALCGLLLAARNVSPALSWVNTVDEDVKKVVEKGKSQFAGNELKGKTLGVIGLGVIGVMVANAAQSLGMKVIGYDPYITVSSAHELSNAISVGKDLATILPSCDYVSIHVPAIEETKGMIDSRRFGQMKDGAVLLNFSRDSIVNDHALLEALSSCKIKNYVTDFPNEDVLGKDGVISIPHLGASTSEAEDNCAIMAANEIMDYIERGNITNSVNYPNCSMGNLNQNATARICILNKNVPSILGKITGIMADLNINIRDLTNKSKGDFACTLMDIDGDVSEEVLKEALGNEEIVRVRVIR